MRKPLIPREAVLGFACEMERQLRGNDDKGERESDMSTYKTTEITFGLTCDLCRCAILTTTREEELKAVLSIYRSIEDGQPCNQCMACQRIRKTQKGGQCLH